MSYNFNLNEPLLSQQAVKKMLESSVKSSDFNLSLEHLRAIAQTAIAAELLNCGRSESELVSLDLTCDVPRVSEDLGNQGLDRDDTSVAENHEDVAFQPLPVSEKFLSLLVHRLDEAATSSNLVSKKKVRLSANFTSGPVLVGSQACCEGRFQFAADGKNCDYDKSCLDPDTHKPTDV